MFSGGDSSEGLNSLNQLGAYGFVNQVAVSNAMAAGQNIDWAQLAQQWIQMRDNAGSNTRALSNMNENKINQTYSESKFEEKGEADMDMDDEEQQTDEKVLTKVDNNFSSAAGLHHNTMNQPWFFGDGTSTHLDPQSSSNNQWSTWPNRDALQQQPSINSNFNNRPINPTSHIPSLLKMNVPHPNEIRIMHDTPNQPENTTNTMDSAKRKVLPAWIREGLEKMEREKQRQLEREKEKKHPTHNWSDDDCEKSKDISSKSKAYVKGEEGENLDEESSDNESGVQNIEANVKNDTRDIEENDLCSVAVGKTYEQKLADLMTVVRRTLTELLLETTNEEITKVSEETVKLFKSKASSAQVIQKSALSAITGKLGLAAYADSSSEENSDIEAQDFFKKDTYQSDSDNNSEEELRNSIRAKRRAFAKISEEIEERVLSAAAREEEKLKYFSRKEEEEERENNRKKQEHSLFNESTSSGYSGHNNKGYEKDFGEITETKIQNINGKRQKDRNSRKERTTRFSDNKDKYVALPATASFIANMNVTGTKGSGGATTALPSTSQRQNIPDINGLLPNYTSTGMTNVLNAADAALEKVLKRKSSESPKKQRRHHDRSRGYTPLKKRQRRSSSSKNSRSHSKSNSSNSSSSSSTSTSSSDTDSSSSSRSSHHSKYSHRSSTKHKSHSSSGKKYEKSDKDHKDYHKYSSSSHTKKDRGSASGSHYRRNASSDSDDEYSRRRRNDSHYSRNSSYSRKYTSSRHDREHSRSLSRSSYSSSSNRRQ